MTEQTRGRTSSGGVQFFLEGMRALPTLPSVLFRFLGLVADPETGADQLANFIYKDPALLTRVLSLLHTVPLGGSLPAEYLRQTIALLGRERIRNLAFTTPLVRSFDPLQIGFNPVTFWERSLLCAHACEALGRHMCLPEPEQYYVAGLLHDVGYLLFLQKSPAALQVVIERVAANPAERLEIESEVMGIDHCQLGMEVAGRLHLAPWIGRAIGLHHFPSRDSDPITRITSVGGAFCSCKGIDLFPSGTRTQDERQREMKEIIGGLLPSLPPEGPAQLLAAMEEATRRPRSWISEMIMEFHSGGNGNTQATASRPLERAPAVPASLDRA